MKIKKSGVLLFTVVFLLLNPRYSHGQHTMLKPIKFGFQIGVGLPKVPFAIYHPPVGISASINLNLKLNKKFVFQVNANGLHAFNLGTVTSKKSSFNFDLLWFGTDIMFNMRQSLFSRQFIVVGAGRYKLNQLIDTSSDNLITSGINLGFIQWSHHEQWTTTIDMRWHLLFEPSPKAQVLIITIGMLF